MFPQIYSACKGLMLDLLINSCYLQMVRVDGDMKNLASIRMENPPTNLIPWCNMNLTELIITVSCSSISLATMSSKLSGNFSGIRINGVVWISFYSLSPERCDSNFKSVISWHRLCLCALHVKMLSSECHRTPLMIIQHYVRLGVIRQQTITWANVDP